MQLNKEEFERIKNAQNEAFIRIDKNKDSILKLTQKQSHLAFTPAGKQLLADKGIDQIAFPRAKRKNRQPNGALQRFITHSRSKLGCVSMAEDT